MTNQAPIGSTLVAVAGLGVDFRLGGGLFATPKVLRAVDAVSLEIQRGEVLAIVGESGCGKTTLAKAILGLRPPTRGEVSFEGQPLASLGRRAISRLVQPVFQDPYSSLNPRQTVAAIIALPLIVQGKTRTGERRAMVEEMMANVGLPRRLANAYPSQLSGGQRQRVAIARALITRPRLIVCDEPTSALDVSVRAQILNLLQDLRRDFDLTYVFISHDLSVVHHIATRVAVMYLGRVVEIGPAEAVFDKPRHPYTQMLLGSVLPPDPDHALPELTADAGFPDPMNPPAGCHFHPRCAHAMDVCRAHAPQPIGVSGALVACHLLASGPTAASQP